MRSTIVDLFRHQAPAHPSLLDHIWRSPQSGTAPVLNSYHTRKRAVLRLAACIEPDAMEREQWFSRDPIASFQGRTAEQLLLDGQEDALMAFLADLIYQDIGIR